MLTSDLRPGCRHLVHVLCVRIDAKAGVILPAYAPSLTDLARDTGRNRRTIMRYLNTLERSGWVTRTRPPVNLARQQKRRTAYRIQIPPDYPQARDSTSQTRPGASGGMPQRLGAGPKEARGGMPHRSSGSSTSSGAEIEAIIKAIYERAGITVTPEWAGRVLEQILGARDNIRRPEQYLRRVITAAPPGTYVPTQTPPRFTRDKGFE